MKQKSRGKTPKPDSKSSKTSGCSPRSPFLRAARASRRSPGQCGCLTAVSVGQLSGGYVGAGQYSADQSGKSPHLPLPGPPTRHLFKLTKSPMQILLVGGVHRGISLLVLIGEGNGTPLQYSCRKIPWTEEPGRLQSPEPFSARSPRLSSLPWAVWIPGQCCRGGGRRLEEKMHSN